MANRYIQTHTPDGNELDNKILPEGTIAARGNQLIVGDGVTEASELEPSGDPAWAGGGVSFVIASGTVDLNVSGTTELTYTSGVNGANHVPQWIVIEPANETDTYTDDENQDAFNLNFNSNDFALTCYDNYIGQGQITFDGTYPKKMQIMQKDSVGSLLAGFNALSSAVAASKWEFIVGATPPSTTQFRVNVKILGIKTA